MKDFANLWRKNKKNNDVFFMKHYAYGDAFHGGKLCFASLKAIFNFQN